MRATNAILATAVLVASAHAEPAPSKLDLESALRYAASHHPTTRADAANLRAAEESVDVERAKYTPDLELCAQLDRSTSNVVPGAYFAVPGLPVVAGTPGRTFDSGHFGTAAGATASWDALGYRKWDAMIDKAQAEVRLARDSATASTLDLEYLAADRFIAAVERDQAVKAAKAGVDRAQVFLTIVQATVGSDLRAGADLSRAKAELSFAKTALSRAETARDVALADLREALGAPQAPVELDAGGLAAAPPPALTARSAADPHIVAAEDRVRVADAEKHVLATGTQPKHLSPDDVAQQLAKSNLTLPAGNVRVGDMATIADTNAMVKDVKELGDVPLRSGSGPTVFVRDIGRVEDSSDVVANIALVNGRRTVYMPLTKRADASTLDVVANIKHALPAMRAQLPPDIKLDMVFDQSAYVSRAIHGLVFEGILGALLTSLAVILFLRNVRSALIVILTIPLSVLAAIVGLRLAGQTINIMTLGGLALAVGILVDEATVAIENIDTHLARGAPPARAVLDAMHEVMAPRFLAMLSVIAVFIPSLFMVGIGRALFPPLAMAVAFAMIASYLLSSSLVPVLATWLLRPRAPHEGRQPLRDAYARLAGRIVHWRWLAAPIYLALVVPLIWLVAGGLPTQLFPRADNGQMELRIRAPSGTRLERTEEIVRSIDEAVRAESGNHVELTLANIGNPAWTFPVNGVYVWNAGPQEALMMVSLKPGAPSVPALEDRLRARLHREMPDVHISFEAGDIVSQVLDFGAPTPIDVSVTGSKLADDRAFAEKLRAALEKEHRLRDVQIRQALDYPTLDVKVDRERAGQLGLTVDRIGKSIVSATSSSVLVTPNFWTNPATGVAYRVAMRVPENEIQSANDLLDLPVMTDPSANTLLRDVASVTPGTTPGEVDHYNSQRTISIVANVAGDDFGAAGADVRRAIASVGPPPRGVTVAVHGQTEQLRLAVDSLVTGLAIAIVVVLFLLVAAFQSPRDALVVILIVPAVLAGVAIALALTGQTLNVQSLMGAIMSIGVSIANGLLLVTFARERRVAGDDKATAIASAARARLRPIVMTSLAMIAGMIPMAMGIGSGGGEATALGTAVIGGLAASTLASLLFVPPLYAIVARGGAYRPPSLDPDDPQRTAHA